MDNPVAWWIFAGILVALELASGTFYLLMLSLGAVAGALAAHAGLSPTVDWIAFALVGGGAVCGLYFGRRRFSRRTPEDVRHDNLDLGATVEVATWSPEGETRVHYRGSDWPARCLHPAAARKVGPHRIAGQDGNVLLLDPLPTAKSMRTDDPPVAHHPG